MLRNRSRTFWLRLTLPVLTVLLAGTAPAFSYLYQQDVLTDRSVSQLRVTDSYLPKSVRLDWNYTGLGGLANPVYEVRRRLGMSTTVLGQTTNRYFVDSFSWSWGSGYDYDVRVVTDLRGQHGSPRSSRGSRSG